MARKHQALVGNAGFQFTFTEEKQQAPSPLIEPWRLGSLSGAATVVFELALGLFALAVIVLLVRGARDARRPPKPSVPVAAPALPATNAQAEALLATADALAARGLYAEAVHTLLLQGLADIAARYPALLRPATTSRTIARLEALPGRLRDAFARIAEAVERSRFAGRAINADVYAACRRAYADANAAGTPPVKAGT